MSVPPTSERSTIVVNVVERIRALMGHEEIGYGDEVEYAYNGGYEILRHRPEGGGMSEYRGVFHPNGGMCEGGGVCKWCGTVMW